MRSHTGISVERGNSLQKGLNMFRRGSKAKKSLTKASGACIERLDPRLLFADFAIVSGQTIASVMPNNGSDQFSFSGNVGESVWVAVAASTAAEFRPEIDLLSPDGTLLHSASAFQGERSTTFLFENLRVAGTHRVVARDRFNAGGGAAYNLSVASIGPLATRFEDEDGRGLTSGQTLSATMARGDLDVYTFEASVGDSFRIAVAETQATGFEPLVRVFGPTGARIVSDTGGTAATVALTNLPEFGRYYVVVGDGEGDGQDTPYNLSFVQLGSTQPVEEAGEGGEIFSGETLTGTLTDGDLDVFSFEVPAGGAQFEASLAVTAATVPSGFLPRFDFYTPTGLLLFPQGPVLPPVGLNVPGRYTFVVHDLNGDGDGGGYRLSVAARGAGVEQRAGEDGGEVINGQTRSATISRGDIDVFTFQGVAGSSAVVTMTESIPTAFVPRIDVFGPTDGRGLGSQAGLQSARVDLAKLPATGTYIVFARDQFGTADGAAYTFSLTTSAPPPVAPRLSSAATATVNSRSMTAALRVAAIDDMPEGELSYTWSLLSGPGTATFAAGNGSNGSKMQDVTVSALGEYTFGVRVTDAGGSFVEGTTKATFVAAATSVTVTPGTVTVPLGSSQQFSAVAIDQLGRPFVGGVTWSVSGGGWVDSTGLYSTTGFRVIPPRSGSDVVVTANIGGATGQATLTIAEPTPVSPRITSAASARVEMREMRAALSVGASDDRSESELRYTWSVAEGPSGVIFGSGNGTNAGKTIEATVSAFGTYRFLVRVRDAGGAEAESSVAVTFNAVAARVTVNPSDATVPAGSSRQFTATVADQLGGAFVGNLVWSVSGGGTISGDGLFTASTTAVGPFTVSVRTEGVTGTASGTVTAATAGATSPTIASAASAVVNDRFMSAALFVSATDDSPVSQLSYTWSLVDGPGTALIGSSNIPNRGNPSRNVTVSALGTYTFRVRVTDPDGNFVDSTTTATFVAVPVTVAVSPENSTVRVGESRQFSAMVRDQLNQPFPGAVTWSVDSGGTVSESGLFVPSADDLGLYNISATVAGVTGTTAVTVIDATAVDTGLISENGDGSEGSPDFVLTNVTLAKPVTVYGAVVGGTVIRGSVTMRNIGVATAVGATSMTLYLSSDGLPSADDRVLTTVPVQINSRRGQSRSLNFSVTVPQDVTGSRQVVAWVNGEGSVVERTTMNNSAATASFAVQARFTDLAAVSVKPVNARPGKTATVTATLANRSNFIFAGAAPVRFVFTDDNGATTVLGTSATQLNLQPGKSKAFNFKLPISFDLAGKSGSISVTIDPDASSSDANRNNNSASADSSVATR